MEGKKSRDKFHVRLTNLPEASIQDVLELVEEADKAYREGFLVA